MERNKATTATRTSTRRGVSDGVTHFAGAFFAHFGHTGICRLERENEVIFFGRNLDLHVHNVELLEDSMSMQHGEKCSKSKARLLPVDY